MCFMKKVLIISILALVAVAASGEDKQKIDRGFGSTTTLYIPKGTMSTGLSLSYHKYDAGNGDIGYSLLSMIDGLEGSLSTINVAPMVTYFIANNTSIGGRFNYAYTSMDIDKASLSLDDDTNFDFSNHYFNNQKYTGSLIVRNYVPLFGSKIFSIFEEVRLGGFLSQGKSYQYDDDGEKDGTYSNAYGMDIGLYAGLNTFVTNNFAFEVSINLLKCEFSYSKQTENQVYNSSLSHFGTTFKPNLLSLNFAIVYYFQLAKR